MFAGSGLHVRVSKNTALCVIRLTSRLKVQMLVLDFPIRKAKKKRNYSLIPKVSVIHTHKIPSFPYGGQQFAYLGKRQGFPVENHTVNFRAL